MTTVLAIETSSRRASVAISHDGAVVFDSDEGTVSADGFDLAKLVMHALESAEVSIGSIGAIAVDIGPGGLNAVRAGVTFANGLALSIGVPMLAATSMEIMAHQATSRLGLPVICIRGATQENACLALPDGTGEMALSFGGLQDLAGQLARLEGRHAVAGRFRRELIELVPTLALTDSGIESPTAAGLLALVAGSGKDKRTAAPISIIYPDGPRQ